MDTQQGRWNESSFRWGQQPEVSVIVPVYNGSAQLSGSLAAVLKSTYPKLELIVVDDGSTDDSAAVAERFPCRVLRLRRRSGPGEARNIGAAMARGQVLFFTDADVMLMPDAISQSVQLLWENPALAGVIGSYTVETTARNFVSVHKNLVHHFVHRQSAGPVAAFFTACGAIRREVFDRFGGFSSAAKDCALEDLELGFRLFRAGQTIINAPHIQATHMKRYTFASLMHSDLWQRAVPYTFHMLRHRLFRNEMSTTRGHRISVTLSYIVFLALLASLATGSALAAAVAILTMAAYSYVNRRLCVFVRALRGNLFLVASMLLLFFTYICSGVGLAIGVFRYCQWKFTERLPRAAQRSISGMQRGA